MVMNKYERLVEKIDQQEAIVEQKDNLAEQLSQVTASVEVISDAVKNLSSVVEDIENVTRSATAVAIKIDTSVELITRAIQDSKDIVVQHKLDDATIKQLENRYNDYLKAESELLNKHHQAIRGLLNQNIVECKKVVSDGDGIYLGRKTFMWLFFGYMVFFGIILVEIVCLVAKWVE